jgi:conserved hypothetical protein, YceG family
VSRRGLLRAAAGCLLLGSLVLAFFLWAVAGDFYSNFGKEVFVDIPRGTGTRQIASMLKDAGVIRSEWQFLAARALSRNAILQAGEYRFSQPASPWEVYRRIARGDVHYYQLTVPEGSNLWDIDAAVSALGIMQPGEFLATARNPEIVQRLIGDVAPQAPTLEGYLFPSTYRVTKHTTAEQLARQMVTQFRKVWESLGAPGDAHHFVTLASLVEKESAVPAERPLVASVYQNRLAKSMRLDCDPTTVYAALLEGAYRGVIYRSDLERKHPYNTYQNPGLPPGPIANPGREALTAALRPAQTNYYYFVAKPDGSGAHVFSEEYESHARAVAEYRRGIQKAEPAGAASRVAGSAIRGQSPR